ncbi:OmpA family protein [bacterium]|nr:OmpA family protein [bacterium]
MKRLLPIIFLLQIVSISCFATKYAAEFTDLSVSVRAAGMGGTFTSFDSDPQTIWWNPSGLAGLSDEIKFYYMHATMFDNLYQLDAGAAARQLGNSYWGLGFFRNGTEGIPFTHNWGYFDYGVDNLPGTGDQGEDNGQWDPGERIDSDAVYYHSEGDYLFTIAAGRALSDRLIIGASIKHLQSYIGQYSAFGFGADLGATYKLKENLVLGATLRDAVGTHIRWSTGLWEQKIPSLWWGGKFSLDLPAIRGNLALAGDFETHFEDYNGIANIGPISIDPHLGTELNILKHFFLRLGLDRKDFTAGAGIALAFFRVDYAFVDNTDLNVTHRIGINFEIPEVKIKLPKRKKPEESGLMKPPEILPIETTSLLEEEEEIIPAPVGDKIAEVKFPFASIELTDRTIAQLDSVCYIWNKYRTNRIYIEGHTDNIRIDTPEFPDNYTLSEARTEVVAKYLRDKCDIPVNRIVVDWFGSDRPKADNSTDEGQSLNRRVEIFLWEP